LYTSVTDSRTDRHHAYQERLRQLVAPYADKPVMVHSDLFHASPFVPRTMDRERLLAAHRDFLDNLGVSLAVAAFNYQFPRTLAVDLRTAAVEVGPLGDFMRDHWASERTFDPVFSFLLRHDGASIPKASDGLFIAFAERSYFPHVAAQGGAVLMYGAGISALTMLHYAELVAGGPIYRYDKDFAGTAIDWHGRAVSILYRYHVRPLGRHLVYDWVRIQSLLLDAGVVQWIERDRAALGFLMDGRMLVDTLAAALKHDPLCLLDAQSRDWVEPELQRLGRRFTVTDFEPVP
jgi:aminoglycoside N3'-acetyltransferase